MTFPNVYVVYGTSFATSQSKFMVLVIKSIQTLLTSYLQILLEIWPLYNHYLQQNKVMLVEKVQNDF